MTKIPTAKEFLKEKGIDNKIVEDILVEFAKLHLKAQAKEISEKIQVYSVTPVMGGKPRYTRIEVNKESIINAYPEENIK